MSSVDPSSTDARTAIGPVGRADALGWASAALGAPMILAPRRLLSEIGVRPGGRATAAVVAIGLREFNATLQINVMRHRRVGAWARVAGDTMDLSLLATAFATRRERTGRLLGAIGFVAAIFATDLMTARALSAAERADVPDGAGSHGIGAPPARESGPAHVRAAVTIRKSPDEIREAMHEFGWSAFDARALEAAGGLRLLPAPGDRGTEVHVDFEAEVTGGGAGAAALKLAGRAPGQRTSDELRQFKALVETGVVPRSDKTPAGPTTPAQMAQRPGNPAGAAA